MNILVDAFGGDNAPEEVIQGSLLALYRNPTLNLTLVGKQDVISNLLADKSYDKSRLFVINANEVISCDEPPVEAIRTKKESSIVVCLDLLKTGEYDGLVSAGSTGAVLSGAVLKLGRLPKVSRPALSPLLPTQNGGKVLLIDCGANMDSKPINLCHFALMGSEYMRVMYNVEKPRVALLSVGVENAKGNELVKSTFPMISKLPINFVGNMEARDALSGDYDVIVTDGFAGNVLLKSVEGTAAMLIKIVKKGMLSTFGGKIGGLLVKKPLKKALKIMDYEAFGGSPLLGTKRLVVKSHGSSKARSFLASIEQVKDFAEKDLLNKIANAVASVEIEDNILNGAE